MLRGLYTVDKELHPFVPGLRIENEFVCYWVFARLFGGFLEIHGGRIEVR
jgi:hypothetical protein